MEICEKLIGKFQNNRKKEREELSASFCAFRAWSSAALFLFLFIFVLLFFDVLSADGFKNEMLMWDVWDAQVGYAYSLRVNFCERREVRRTSPIHSASSSSFVICSVHNFMFSKADVPGQLMWAAPLLAGGRACSCTRT
jgi:hypothetical protein